MSPEQFPADDPREWLNRARSNLARAKTYIAETYLEDYCFDAQQAAEKALKAVLMHRQIPFPYVHDLAELLTLLERSGTVPSELRQAARLTRFAIQTRYPGASEPVTPTEYQEVTSIAERVVRWAQEQIGHRA